MNEAVPPATGIRVLEDDTLMFLPSNIVVSTEMFWEEWHALKQEHGDAWQSEFLNKDQDYNAVQLRVLDSQGSRLSPFTDDDGFVDAVL